MCRVEVNRVFDRYLHPRVKPLLNRIAATIDRPEVTPDRISLVGFLIGALALPFLAMQWYFAALLMIVINRLFDGLDGALARRRDLSDAGGFLDIALDFLFYALVPFGFVLASPTLNAVAGAWLLFAFIGTGSSFLAFAAVADKYKLENLDYPHKSFYYLGGLTEGAETILVFVLFCLFPAYFPLLAWLFGALCWFTTLTRVWGGYHTLRRVAQARGE
jgi:phosphatidylglycerophosphate synthase